MTRTWIVVVVLLVIVICTGVGLGAYAYGMTAGQKQAADANARIAQARATSTATDGTPSGPATSGSSRGTPPATPISGQVREVVGDTIELNTLTGIIVVKVSDQTQYQKTMPASLADIQPGERITVQCNRGGDGSYTARFLQIGGGRMLLPGAGGN